MIRRNPDASAARAAPLLLAVFALFVLFSSAASALTVTITSPPTGQWTASDMGVVNGTASGATPDRFLLDTTADFSGGSSTNTSQASGLVNHTLPSNETWRYSQDFSSGGPVAIDPFWQSQLYGTGWALGTTAGLAAPAPSLYHPGTLLSSITFRAVLPSPLLSGRLDFKYECLANGNIDARLSGDGSPSNEASVIAAGSSALTQVSYDLAGLAGSSALFVRFSAWAATTPSTACAVDDFLVIANYTRVAASNYSFRDDFSAGGNAAWEFSADLFDWNVTNSSAASDTPPAATYAPAGGSGEMIIHWAFVSELKGAWLSYHRQCEANATMVIYASTDLVNETQVEGVTYGSPHAVKVANLTAVISGGHALYLRITARSPAPADSTCGIDDVVMNATVVGNANLSYTGLFLSRFFDLGYSANISAADFAASLPNGSSVNVSIRLSTNNISYSPFSEILAAGGPVTPAAARYFQLRVAFASQGGLAAAAFDRLGVNFTAFAAVEWSLDGSTWNLATGTFQWTATVPLASGSNTVTVRVRDSTGATATSFVAILKDTFPPSAPGKPAGPSVTNGTNATWSWLSSVDVGLGVAQYLVDVGFTQNGTELLASAVTTATNFTVTDLPEGVRVFVRVRAVDLGGLQSAYSPSSDALLVDRTAPAAVAAHGPGYFVSTSSLRWTWGAGQDVGSGVVAYLVRIGTVPGANNSAEVTTTNLSYTFSSGVSATTYFATVHAIDAAGNVGLGVASTPTTVDTDPPLAPSSVSGPPSITNETTLTWSWAAGVDAVSGIDHYYITLGSTPGGTDVAGLAWTVLTYTLSFATSGARYYFTVSPVDLAGNVGVPVAAPVVLVDSAAPSTPVLSAVPSFVGDTTQTIRWSASTDASPNGSGVDQYRVRVSDGTNTTITLVDALLLVLNLIDGRVYSVGVAALDLAGNLGVEGTLSFSADLSGPAAPQGLRVSVQNPSLPTFSATWNATVDVGSGIKEYRVSVGTTQGGSDVIDSRLAGGTNFTWTGEFNQNYYVTVWAVDKLGHTGNKTQATSGVSMAQGGGGFLPGFDSFGAVVALAACACVALGAERLRRRR